MRDDDLARRAQQAGFVSAEQLREAREFAAGGRSLLSVLLDLGHLKPDDLLRLGAAPPAARAAKLPWILIGAAPIAAILVAVLWSWRRPAALPPEPWMEASPPTPSLSFAEQAVDRARGILDRVERSLDSRGRPPAAADAQLRRAAALLEEALPQQAGADTLLPLARARELLDEWELSRELYRRLLQEQPDLRAALLGAARVDLLMQDPASARRHAEQACSLASPPAEAYYLRGAAALAQGDAGAADGDLARALQLDASLRPRIDALVSRRSPR